jgi:hypothetical protein
VNVKRCTSPLWCPQNRRYRLPTYHFTTEIGEASIKLPKDTQEDVEKISTTPFLAPLARNFPSGENSKATMEEVCPLRIASVEYSPPDIMIVVCGEIGHVEDYNEINSTCGMGTNDDWYTNMYYSSDSSSDSLPL